VVCGEAGCAGVPGRKRASAIKQGPNKHQIALANFLVSKGRIDEALAILYKLRTWPRDLPAIGAVLRSAGLDKEAQEYDKRSDAWEKSLDAIDDCLE